MPTTEPLDYGDDAGGQLKPIAEFSQPAPVRPAPARPAPAQPAPAQSAPARPAASAPAAPRPAAPAPRPLASPPSAAPGATLRTTLRQPVLSMRHLVGQAPPQTSAAATTNRVSPFDDNDVKRTWQDFIDRHPTEHLLVNTMRAAPPVPADGQPAGSGSADGRFTARAYDVVVENTIQVEELRNRMDELTGFFAEALDNDHISFNVLASDGPSSPQTWNEHQVLESMLTTHPELRDFIDGLQLTQF